MNRFFQGRDTASTARNPRRWRPRLVAPAALVLLLGLPAASSGQCDAPLDLGRGPVNFHVPAGYDDATPAPLLVVLHTFGGSGASQEEYMKLTPWADMLGFLYTYPDATRDPAGDRFWNATEVCCDNFDSGVDDSAYLRDLIDTIVDRCNVDPRRIYLFGHSNGAYMSYRMACEHADTLTAIVALAGATYVEPEVCEPSKPVHVVHIHGTADETWFYEGGRFMGDEYPGAAESAEIWADYNGCSAQPQPIALPRDLDESLPGEETTVLRYGERCLPGSSVELWTIEGGRHIPDLSADFNIWVLGHLLSRTTPACTGDERLSRAVCRSRGRRVVLKLAGGLPFDGYRAELSTGETFEGRLGRSGRARLRSDSLAICPESVTVRWSCGASISTVLSSPGR